MAKRTCDAESAPGDARDAARTPLYASGLPRGEYRFAAPNPLRPHLRSRGAQAAAIDHGPRARAVPRKTHDGREQAAKRVVAIKRAAQTANGSTSTARASCLDAAYGTDASQAQVRESTSRSRRMRGAHATVFAYGQTGAGKTPCSGRGLLPRRARRRCGSKVVKDPSRIDRRRRGARVPGRAMIADFK